MSPPDTELVDRVALRIRKQAAHDVIEYSVTTINQRYELFLDVVDPHPRLLEISQQAALLELDNRRHKNRHLEIA